MSKRTDGSTRKHLKTDERTIEGPQKTAKRILVHSAVQYIAKQAPGPGNMLPESPSSA